MERRVIDMLSIDEAIARERQQAKEQRNHIGTWDEEYSKKCEEYAEEHEQLAEWLEELKSYRASVFSGYMTQKMLKEEYNKAIDDFAEKLKSECREHYIDCDPYFGGITDSILYEDDIEEIAEQLKVGIKE